MKSILFQPINYHDYCNKICLTQKKVTALFRTTTDILNHVQWVGNTIILNLKFFLHQSNTMIELRTLQKVATLLWDQSNMATWLNQLKSIAVILDGIKSFKSFCRITREAFSYSGEVYIVSATQCLGRHFEITLFYRVTLLWDH